MDIIHLYFSDYFKWIKVMDYSKPVSPQRISLPFLRIYPLISRIQDFRNNEVIPHKDIGPVFISTTHFIMGGHTIQTMDISRIL